MTFDGDCNFNIFLILLMPSYLILQALQLSDCLARYSSVCFLFIYLSLTQTVHLASCLYNRLLELQIIDRF